MIPVNRRNLILFLIAAAFVATILLIHSRQAHRPAEVPAYAPAAHVGPAALYPEPDRTPGFANPEITQANIGETICNPEWSTKSIRPPSSYTTRLKHQQMQEWGLPGTTAEYEEDHFISLELGGNPTDPRNLWPEPYNPAPGARQKDVVENYLHRQVCAGALTLEQAQAAIVRDWYQVYLQVAGK